MAEVMVKGEDLSGLGWTIKSLIDGNMEGHTRGKRDRRECREYHLLQ